MARADSTGAPRPVISVDDKTYLLAPLGRGRGFIDKTRRPDFAVSRREEQPSLQSVEGIIVKGFPDSSLGHGRRRINRNVANKGSEYRYVWKARADTRWPHGVHPPIREQDSTLATNDKVVRASTSFKGNLWALFENLSSTTYEVYSRIYDGSETEWSGGGGLTSGSEVRVALDIMATETHLLAAIVVDDDHQIRRSTDGASWAASSTPPTTALLVNNVTANENIDAGLLAYIGGEAVLAAWHEDVATITFFSSTNAGDDWADENVDIASGNGPQGIAVMKGTDGADKLYVGTAEGLWEVDTSPAPWVFTLVDPLPYHEDNCRRMTVHSGALYYGVGVSDDETFKVHRLSNQQGRQTVEPDWGIGGDGLDTELQGPIRRMVSRGDELFVCFGGGKASRNGQIFSMLPDGSWHYMGRNSTANQRIDWMAVDPQDDGTQRLHYSKRTASSTTTTHFLGNPLSHPLSGATIERESGLVQYPYIDWGFPFESKMILRLGGNTESLDSGTSAEYIDVKYQVDHTYTSMSDLGNFDAATERLSFPAGSANGEGLSAQNLGLELTLNVNTNPGDFTLKDLEIEAIVNKTPTYFYNVMVDVEETSETVGDRDISVIRSDLEGLESSGAKVKVIFGDSGASYKRVVEAKYDFIIEDTDMGNAVDTKARLIPVVNLTLEDIP